MARRWCLWWTGFAAVLVGALVASLGPVAAQEVDDVDAGDVASILLVVSNVEDGVIGTPEGGLLAMVGGNNFAEQQLAESLSQHGSVRAVADQSLVSEDLVGIDLVVITAATDSAEFQPFLFKATVPVVAMKPANWNALGLAKRNADASTPLQLLGVVQPDFAHPIAAKLDRAAGDDVSVFTGGPFRVGRGWVAGSEPVGDAVADVVAAGPDGAALIAYEPGDALGWPYIDESDTAMACRVAFPSHSSKWALLSDRGLALFDGAIEWTLGDACSAQAGPTSPALHNGLCFTEAANEDEIARDGELVPREILDEPNLSSLWVRAIEFAEVDDQPVAFFGGRFRSAFDADSARDDDGTLAGGIDRQGLFGCNVDTGMVTALNAPITIDSLAPIGDSVLNERVRALAHDGTWLYVGGKFGIDVDALDQATLDALPEALQRSAVSLIRVDPRTGEIDVSWRPNIRGSVSALAIHDGWLYAGGGIRLADEQPVTRLIRLSIADGADGTTDPSFTPEITADVAVGDGDPFAAVLALEVVGDTLYAGGSFQQVDGQRRNSIAAFDLTTTELTPFAPSLGDNNVGTDLIAQIKDIALMADGSILACGDWWLVSPVPNRTWTAYDHDGGEADPNGDDWFGQRSKVQPRPNQFNHGKFDPVTGAAAMVDGVPWGPVTDGGIQACDVDPQTGVVILGGHYESIGQYEPGFEPADQNDYPGSHVAYEKLTAVDGVTGEIIARDTDIDSIRGLDAVAIIPGVASEGSEIIVGGAMTVADRLDREGIARYIIE